MNPELLVKGLVQQNKLLKETIDHFPLINTNTLSTTCNNPADSISDQQVMIQSLLDLLDRQESRLILLEQFGKSVLLESQNNQIPVFRGLQTKSKSNSPQMTPTPMGAVTNEVEPEIDVKEWSKLMLNHLNCLKPYNTSSIASNSKGNQNHNNNNNSKEIIQFITNKLDLEPLNLVKNLLNQNRALLLNKFPNEIPLNLRLDKRLNNPTIFINDLDQLFEYPFKLYPLRHPKALLNLITSKFNLQEEQDQEDDLSTYSSIFELHGRPESQ